MSSQTKLSNTRLSTAWELGLRGSNNRRPHPVYRSPVRPETRSSAMRSQTSPVGRRATSPQRRALHRPPWDQRTTVNSDHKWGRGQPLPERPNDKVARKHRDGVIYPGWQDQWHQYPCNHPTKDGPDKATPEHWSYAMQRRLMDDSMLRGSPTERRGQHPGFVQYDPNKPLERPATVHRPVHTKTNVPPGSPNAPSLVQVAAPTAKAPPPAPAPAPAPAYDMSGPVGASSTESNLPAEGHIQRAEDEWNAAVHDHSTLQAQLSGSNSASLDPDELEFMQGLVTTKAQTAEQKRQLLVATLTEHIQALNQHKAKNDNEARQFMSAAASLSGEDRDDMEWLASACQSKSAEAGTRINQLSAHPAFRAQPSPPGSAYGASGSAYGASTSGSGYGQPPSNPYGAPPPATGYPNSGYGGGYTSNSATANELDLDISDDEGPGPSMGELRRAANSIVELP